MVLARLGPPEGREESTPHGFKGSPGNPGVPGLQLHCHSLCLYLHHMHLSCATLSSHGIPLSVTLLLIL